ncbi:MAG: GNAT family N-acetyltransferase [Alphaproteobacteria bacterium]|nr:MAG: GNAT family N-acetyltransferase [Alphaproteobacteria bacterium]
MAYDIRPIAEDHIAGFHAALDYVAREKKYLAFLEAPPLDKTSAFIRNNIREDYPQFVALAGGKVVGWCDVIPAKDRPIHAHTGVLGIGILPEFRGKGMGRALMTATIAKARTKGLTRIELTVRENNVNAIALYKKIGFETEGIKKNAVRIDGVYENICVMGLLF